MKPIRIALITPCKNEALNLPHLNLNVANLAGGFVEEWVIVENGSIDNTIEVAERLQNEIRISVVQLGDLGGMRNAAEFLAFLEGGRIALEKNESITHVMKLDADVRLSQEYFQELFTRATLLGVSGGPLPGDQIWHIPGCVKMYSKEAFELLHQLPIALGFDVLDEFLVLINSLPCEVVDSARFTVERKTGSSEGLLRGRFRNGIICRWTGYDPLYFCLHVLRYLFSRPFIVGGLFMIYGYLTAGSGPHSKLLKQLQKESQRKKMVELLRHPFEWLKATYLRSA